MQEVQTLLKRNSATMTTHRVLQAKPVLNTAVLSCIDARADPAHFLDLQPGEAVVLRNAGGRVTDDVERQLGLLGFFSRQMGPEMFKLIIVHHTDCGVERMEDPDVTAKVSAVSGVSQDYVSSIAIHDHDHAASLRADVERLNASRLVPAGIHVTALIYDHETGAVRTEFEAVTR